MTHPEYTVLLVSLKAGIVPLNLTEASNVYLVDAWISPSAEIQAMGCIYQFGQQHPVKLTHLIVENSIELRIVSLQEKKLLLANSMIGHDRWALDHLSQQDMQFLFS
ncbi:DNA repair protein rad16 [Coemansia sp. RSA 1933]|nr:DNA repair protein rad16 [Coemansia sp. RSA 1933]